MDTSRSVVSLAQRFFLGTLLSRFSGLIREMLMASCFGATPELACFLLAYRLANLLRRLLGEGNAQSGIIPQFEAIQSRDPQKAFYFYRDIAWSYGGFFLSVAVLVSWVLYFLSLQYQGSWHLVLSLGSMLSLSLFFICQGSVHASLLHCQTKSFQASVSPVLLNGGWIVAIVVAKWQGRSIWWLACGVVLSHMLQWAWSGWQARRWWRQTLSWKEWGRPKLFSPLWKETFRPMTLGLIGIGATQVNSALDLVFAKLADPVGPAYLSFALRVQQLPLALFGIALSSTLLAPLSRLTSQENRMRHQTLLESAMGQALCLIVPCSMALIVLAPTGLNLLYGRGSFSSEALQMTIWSLRSYALGLIPSALVLIMSQAFFSHQHYQLPVRGAVYSMMGHLALTLFFVVVMRWGFVGVAWATSLSSFGQYLYLAHKGSIPLIWKHRLWNRVALASLVSMLVSLPLSSSHTRLLSEQLIEFALQAGVFASIFLVTCWLARVEPLFAFFKWKQAP
jgi:putative peptidoglycan lipid II flippase